MWLFSACTFRPVLVVAYLPSVSPRRAAPRCGTGRTTPARSCPGLRGERTPLSPPRRCEDRYAKLQSRGLCRGARPGALHVWPGTNSDPATAWRGLLGSACDEPWDTFLFCLPAVSDGSLQESGSVLGFPWVLFFKISCENVTNLHNFLGGCVCVISFSF